MEAVLLAVVDVLAEHPALDAQLGVQRQVGELQRHQGLLVVRVQQLAVVGVVLQREAAADAVILDLTDFAGVLFFLEGRGKPVTILKKNKKNNFLSWFPVVRKGTQENGMCIPCWCSRLG